VSTDDVVQIATGSLLDDLEWELEVKTTAVGLEVPIADLSWPMAVPKLTTVFAETTQFPLSIIGLEPIRKWRYEGSWSLDERNTQIRSQTRTGLSTSHLSSQHQTPERDDEPSQQDESRYAKVFAHGQHENCF
jgi:hypothetical protein